MVLPVGDGSGWGLPCSQLKFALTFSAQARSQGELWVGERRKRSSFLVSITHHFIGKGVGCVFRVQRHGGAARDGNLRPSFI